MINHLTFNKNIESAKTEIMLLRNKFIAKSVIVLVFGLFLPESGIGQDYNEPLPIRGDDYNEPLPFKSSGILIGYNIAYPIGNTNEYIGLPSFRGINAEWRQYVTEHFSLGIKGAYQVFYEEIEDQVYTDNGSTIYGRQFRYINSFPIMAVAGYETDRNDGVNFDGLEIDFYGKLGLGVYSFQKLTDMGLYRYQNEYSWSLGLLPEVGIKYKLTPRLDAVVYVNYNQVFKNASIENQGYVSAGVGLEF
jgi:hypothetical protein